MTSTKQLALAGIFTGLAVLFQVIPCFFSELFIPVTIISTLPIYLISRIKPQIGMASYMAAALLISLISIHEGVFFLCTNGLLGFTLGMSLSKTKKKYVAICIASSALTLSLVFITFILGISVFGFKTLTGILPQMFVLLLFSSIYTALLAYLMENLFAFIVKKCFINGLQ